MQETIVTLQSCDTVATLQMSFIYENEVNKVIHAGSGMKFSLIVQGVALQGTVSFGKSKSGSWRIHVCNSRNLVNSG